MRTHLELTPAIYESPFAATSLDRFALHLAYARLCTRYGATLYGEAGVSSHLLWTQPHVLRDTVEGERELGIDCGLAFAALSRSGSVAHVFYTDLGWSRGMTASRDASVAAGNPFVERKLAYNLGDSALRDELSDVSFLLLEEAEAWYRWAGFP